MSTDIQAMASRAMNFLERGQAGEAMNLYREITQIDAANTDAWLMLGAISGEMGNVDEAISCCRQAIDLEKNNVEANVILGRLLLAKGELQEAADYLRAALSDDPEYGEVWLILAGIEGQLGLFADAAKSGRQAVNLVPDVIEGYINLANALIELERFAEAIEVCSTALGLQPGNAQIPVVLALAYERAGESGKAEESYREVLRLSSGQIDAKLGLGRILLTKGDYGPAEEVLVDALKLDPERHQVHQQLGLVYESMERLDEAEQCYRKVLALAPNVVDAWINLGNVQQNAGQLETSVDSYARALQLAPENAEAHYNKGVLEKRLGDLQAATDSFDKAIELRPDFVKAHWDKAFVCLLRGSFEQGWREYEWRLRQDENIERPFVQPIWAGEDLSGRTILVHDEQGYGDTFQFVRYLPLVKARGGRVVFECHDKLGPILQGCEGYDELIERESLHTVPDVAFDTHVHLMSLPLLFNTRLDSVPQQVPYLRARPDLQEKWAERLNKDPRFKIGICWAGSPRHTNEVNRSCPLETFEQLNAAGEISLYSLQKGPALEQAKGVAESFNLIRIDEELDKDERFVDTAAVIANLDLVISIDTSIVHLAGALGRPVWTLLSTAPDWRWLLEQASNPWYPTMRLFRQTRAGDWGSVFDSVVNSLSQYIKERGR